MAICDLLFLLTGILPGLVIPAWHVPSLKTDLLKPLYYPFSINAYTGSIFFTILVSFERYMAVCRKKTLTIKKTKVYILSVILFNIIYCLPSFLVLKWETKNDTTTVNYTELECNNTFRTLYYMVLNAFFRFIVPSVCLVTFKTLIYKKVKNIRGHQ